MVRLRTSYFMFGFRGFTARAASFAPELPCLRCVFGALSLHSLSAPSVLVHRINREHKIWYH
eukprot:6352197-Amphidinium_carterae.1